jgi:hypothetical protein
VSASNRHPESSPNDPSGAGGPRPRATDAHSTLLFEIAWEVCTQVGGIYTVLRSKAPAMVRRWGDAYCLIAPYRKASARIELEPQPAGGPIHDALEEFAAAAPQVAADFRVGRRGCQRHRAGTGAVAALRSNVELLRRSGPCAWNAGFG